VDISRAMWFVLLTSDAFLFPSKSKEMLSDTDDEMS
jgi:hypothetical protein